MDKKDILISARESKNTGNTGGESGSVIRMAVAADGELLDYAVGRPGGHCRAGDIYKGIVANIFPGTQSCFVNIGQDKNAVMYAKDAAPALLSGSRVVRPIETVLKAGQKVVVQVRREASGDKGAQVTMRLALPGKYVVLLPDSGQCSVSRKIVDTRESVRLRGIAAVNRPEGCGLIVRTEAAGVQEALIKSDTDALMASLMELYRKEAGDKIPDCIHAETDFYREVIFRALEDDVARVIADGRGAYRELLGRAAAHEPDISYKIHYYREPWPLFAFHGVQNDIKNLSERQIRLKCGAYIVIDKTEALTVVDVNTGKYNGRDGPRETILRVNTEAVTECARQIRLRDIGGIIVIDAIRMSDVSDQRAVVRALEAGLAADRNKTVVAGFTRLGLLEMTRKKVKADSVFDVFDPQDAY